MSLDKKLQEFAKVNGMKNKGTLSVALVVTRHAMRLGLPLNPDELLTEAGGQVVGLGKSAVQVILADYHVDRVLAEEGGRTSRGSVGNMKKYAAFLNALHEAGAVDLKAVETWWIDRVREHFAGKPYVLRFDPSKSLRSVIRDLLGQAERRQAQSPGSTLVGTVLQHLVGAKLSMLVGSGIQHHGASVADEASKRMGDFIIEDVAIHVTTAPSEALLRKCRRNLESGMRPVVVTANKGAIIAEHLAEQAGIGDRLDVMEAEQFLAGNLYELGKFAQTGRRAIAIQLIETYNQIIDECERDPGLKIEILR